MFHTVDVHKAPARVDQSLALLATLLRQNVASQSLDVLDAKIKALIAYTKRKLISSGINLPFMTSQRGIPILLCPVVLAFSIRQYLPSR
jgi:hypothetical protein